MKNKLLFIFCLTLYFESSAQDYEPIFHTGAVYKVILYDGSILNGQVTEFKNGLVTIETTAGTFKVRLKDIRKIKGGPERKSESNLDWYHSPKFANYLLAPSAISMTPNEFDYQTSMIFINSLNYGVTNSLAIGGGFELISLLLDEPIFYLIPRFTFPVSKDWMAGAGLLYVSVPQLNINVVDLYAFATYGNSDRNITFGVGYGYSNKKLANTPVANISTVYRLGRKIALVSENWFISRENYIFSYGMRLLFRRSAFDFTLLNNYEIAVQGESINIGIPFITYMTRIGKLN